MNPSFGPWATAVTTGANLQLDTFWKRRLSMLSSLKQSGTHLTRRAVLILVCLTIGALAIPTFRWASDGPLAGLAKPSGSGQLVLLVEGKPAGDSANAPVPDKARPDPVDEYFPRPTAAEKKILDALEKPVDVEFLDLPIGDCFVFLRDQTKVDFWIDKVKLQEEGVTLDTPVTLKLKGRRLESVLNLLLRPLQLDYVFEDDVLKIATATSIGEKLFTRTYPVGDLCPELKEERERAGNKTVGDNHFDAEVRFALFQGLGGGRPKEEGAGNADPFGTKGGGNAGAGSAQAPRPKVTRFSNLMKAITGTVEPDSWEDLSGSGSVHAVEASSCLVVRQTRSVHREVLQLLRDLRAAKRVERRPPHRVEVDEEEAPKQI
jgi:hypothetical protein